MLRVQLQAPREILERIVVTEMNALLPRKKQIVGWMVSYFANLPNPVSGRPLILDIRDEALLLKDSSDFDFALGLAEKAEGLLGAHVVGNKVWDPVEGPISDWQKTGGKFAEIRVHENDFKRAKIVGQLIAYKALNFGEIEGFEAAPQLAAILR